MNGINIRYVDQETYQSGTHDPNILYVVDYLTRIGIYFKDKEVSNVYECTELPDINLAVPGSLYLLKSDIQQCIYYCCDYDEHTEYLPLFDSTISDISVNNEQTSITTVSGTKTVITLDENNMLVPSTVRSQVTNMIGDIDLRPKWVLWE